VTVRTHVRAARERVGDERAAVAAKRDALDTFREEVRSMEPAGRGVARAAAGPVVDGSTGTGRERCSAVRTAFAETVAPHSGEADEGLLETMDAELGEQLALAVAPSTPTAFTPGVRDRLVSAIEARRRELSVTLRALDGEADSLDRTRDTLGEVTDWLATADETPLSALGFEELAARHRTLGTHREACADLARRRQAHLDGTTSAGASVGLTHRDLVAYLYQSLSVDYPVLTTVARLVEVLECCRRAVRDHLVRRV